MMSEISALHVGFPAERFVSRAEFEADPERAEAQRLARGRAEARSASQGLTVRQSGACAVCLRACLLSSQLAPGHAPNPLDQQTCDCEDRLSGRERALLHAAQAVGGLRPWSRALLWGPASGLRRRLDLLAGALVQVTDTLPDRPIAAAAFHALLAPDCLHRVPALPDALRQLRRLAASGGCLLATFPFHHGASATTPIGPRRHGPGFQAFGLRPVGLHAIGWDILDMMREAGWERAEMLQYWSRELGYYGQHNFLLRAVAA